MFVLYCKSMHSFSQVYSYQQNQMQLLLQYISVSDKSGDCSFQYIDPSPGQLSKGTSGQ